MLASSALAQDRPIAEDAEAIAREELMKPYAYRMPGETDIGAPTALGAMGFGLVPESVRYFDYHHTKNDALDRVNP